MAVSLPQSQGQTFGPAGPNHAPGLVPDPGSTAHSPANLLGDDGAFHTIAAQLAALAPLSVANGGTGDTTLTAHNVLIGEGASAVAFAAPGTAGNVLTSNGASADPTFQALAAQNFTLLNTLTASNSASLTDTTSLIKSFTHFLIIGNNLIPASTGNYQIRVSQNGGSSYAATGYLAQVFGSNSSANAGASSTTSIQINVSTIITTAPYGASFACWLYNPSANNVVMVNGLATYFNNASGNEIAFFGGFLNTQGAVNAIQFLYPAANTSSGIIKIYGLS